MSLEPITLIVSGLTYENIDKYISKLSIFKSVKSIKKHTEFNDYLILELNENASITAVFHLGQFTEVYYNHLLKTQL